MNYRIKLLTIVFIILTNYTAYTQNAQRNAITLKQAVDVAITNNLQVKQSDLQMQNAAVNLRQARANQLPDLIGGLTHGINQGRSIDPFSNSYVNQQIFFGNYNLNSSVVLFNGAELINLIKENALSYNASKMELQQAKDNLTLNVILAYLQILQNEDQLDQSKNQVLLTSKQVERLEILNKEGAIIPAQLYELKGQLANDQLSLINNQNAADGARLTLSQLMNVDYDKNLEVEKLTADQFARFEGDPAAIYQKAVTQLSIIKATELRQQSASRGVKVARGEFYPTIGLSGGLGTNYSSAATSDILLSTQQVPSGDFVTFNGSQVPVYTNKSNFGIQKINYFNQFNNNYNTNLSLNIRIPILNAFQAKNRLALAKIELKNRQYIAETSKIQLKQSIEQAYFNMTASYEKYTTLLQQVSDFNEAFKIAEVRFNAGATNQVEYLIAKNNADRARINLIVARYDYLFRVKILNYYEGSLSL
ncbi:MAG: TolC family protein [Chitinophagaceae bacterium]|nr:TolC family protein [Chitinophagaceae bacterium]